MRLDPGSVAARALAHFELREPVDLDAAERAIQENPTTGWPGCSWLTRFANGICPPKTTPRIRR